MNILQVLIVLLGVAAAQEESSGDIYQHRARQFDRVRHGYGAPNGFGGPGGPGGPEGQEEPQDTIQTIIQLVATQQMIESSKVRGNEHLG